METTDTRETKPPEVISPKANPPKFYRKELISNRLSLPNGRHVQFEKVGDTDTGVLGTTDPLLSAELDKAADAGRGGVVKITESEFQDLKKNPPARRSQIRSFDAQSLRKVINGQSRVSAPVVVEAKHEPSAPMEVPKGLATVSSRRRLQEMRESKTSDAHE